MNVLVTDASCKASLGIVRSLGSKGIHVGVLAASSGDLSSRSCYCHATYVIPSTERDSFVPAVVNILRRMRYDLIIPQSQEAIVSLAPHKSELASLTKLEIPDYDKIRSASDKRYVYELAQGAGVPVPHTVYPVNLEDVNNWVSEFDYPLVIKSARESPGYTLYPRYPRSRADLLGAGRSFCEQEGYTEGNLLLQEFIPGHGCGFFALYQDGVCKRIFMHRRIRENPPSGGRSSCAESFYDARLRDYGTRLLDLLGWHGVAMVEFRYDVRDGNYNLMEINPRFWGSLDLALAAGVDFPHYLCQMAQGHTLEYSEEYKRKLRFHWPLSEEVQHIWRRPASMGAVLADLLNPRVESNIWLRDLGPALHEGYDLARALVRKSVKR